MLLGQLTSASMCDESSRTDSKVNLSSSTGFEAVLEDDTPDVPDLVDSAIVEILAPERVCRDGALACSAATLRGSEGGRAKEMAEKYVT